MNRSVEVVVIGAGVSGMTCALYLKRAGIETVLIEKEKAGGQINRALTVENYPGFKKIAGKDLSKNMVEQMQDLEIDIITDEVVQIDNGKIKKVILKSGDILTSKVVVIATGRKPRKLPIRNPNRYLGKGLSYCATCDGRFFKNKDVIVIGGSNTAIMEAVYLSNICNKVYIIYRGDKLRAEKIKQEEIANIKNIEVKYNCVLSDLIGEEVIEQAVLKYSGDKQQTINISACFASIGQEPISIYFEKLVKVDVDGYIKVDKRGKTNLNGIYACGDVVKKQVYQLVTAMSDAVTVSDSIREYLNRKR